MAANSAAVILIENGLPIDTDESLHEEANGDQENVELTADFRAECAKFRPFRAMKIGNWILLVLLVIGTIFAEKYDLYWSRVGFITVMHVLFLVFTSIALLAGWIASHWCKSFLLSIVEVSVMNICIWTFSIPMLFLNLLFFLLKTVAEYRHFVPKIAHYFSNPTEDGLSALTDSWKPTKRYYVPDPDQQWREDIKHWQTHMAERKFAIFLNLAIDPAIAILEVLALLTSVYLAISMIKMMRQCKVWAPRSEDYKRRHPECSPLEQQYSTLGVLKTVQWLAPALLFFTLLYLAIPFPHVEENLSPELVYMVGLITILCFPQWLSFICKVNLRRQKRDQKQSGLMCTFFWDLILSACIALYFTLNLKSSITSHRTRTYDFLFYIAGTLLYGGSLAINVWLLWKNHAHFGWNIIRWNPPKPKLPQLQLPVSIKVQFSVEVKRKEMPNSKCGDGEANGEFVAAGENQDWLMV